MHLRTQYPSARPSKDCTINCTCFFFRPAIIHHACLTFERPKFRPMECPLQPPINIRHAAHMRQLQSGLHVGGVKYFFNSPHSPAGAFLSQRATRFRSTTVDGPMSPSGFVRMTPASTNWCERPSLIMTPKPVRSVPQSIPRTRIKALAEIFHLRFIDCRSSNTRSARHRALRVPH